MSDTEDSEAPVDESIDLALPTTPKPSRSAVQESPGWFFALEGLAWSWLTLSIFSGLVLILVVQASVGTCPETPAPLSIAGARTCVTPSAAGDSLVTWHLAVLAAALGARVAVRARPLPWRLGVPLVASLVIYVGSRL